MKIEVFVEGIPKGQPRPRAFNRGNRAGVYDPGTADDWKRCIMLFLKRHRPAQPVTGGVIFAIHHYMPRPKSHYGTGKNAGVLKADAPADYTAKPDADNLVKAAMDAITQMGGFWLDDSQVIACTITKRYADNGRHGALIKIQTRP